jgi:hypothetical protein
MSRGKFTETLALLMLVLLCSAILPQAAYANSAESPRLTIIVAFPPGDLTLSLRSADGSATEAVQLYKKQKAWEANYRVFTGTLWEAGLSSPEGAILVVRSSKYNFECALPESVRHNTVLTLDVAHQSIQEGQSTARLLLLISLRVMLTLVIEGLLFFAFGYRKSASWILFVVTNLITQGALNVLLTGPNLSSYWFFGFVFYELIIFIVEAIAFASLLKEHRRSLAVGYAVTANFASLFLGGILISSLPT